MIKKLFLAAVILMFMAANVYATATVTINGKTVMGNKRVSWGYITLSSTYNTGGESVTAADLGLTKLDNISFTINTSIYAPYYDYANKTVVLFQQQNTATVTAHARDSFFVLDDNSAASNGALITVKPLSMFGCMGIFGDLLGTDAFVFARDSSTVLAVADSNYGSSCGDTIYFDEDGILFRLYHSGSVTGYKADYYVPYYTGNRFLQIMYTAKPAVVGVALYFDHDQTEKDEKFTFVSPTNANGWIRAKTDRLVFSPIKLASYQVTAGTAITSIIYFVATGN